MLRFSKTFCGVFWLRFLWLDLANYLLAFIYTADLMPKGKSEFEQRMTGQEGQSKGIYLGVLMRSELEYGITDDFQIAGYLNYSYITAKNIKNISGATMSRKHISDLMA